MEEKRIETFHMLTEQSNAGDDELALECKKMQSLARIMVEENPKLELFTTEVVLCQTTIHFCEDIQSIFPKPRRLPQGYFSTCAISGFFSPSQHIEEHALPHAAVILVFVNKNTI